MEKAGLTRDASRRVHFEASNFMRVGWEVRSVGLCCAESAAGYDILKMGQASLTPRVHDILIMAISPESGHTILRCR